MTPEKGFYYHYKHDPNESINNYAYDVLNIGVNTETKEKFVIYRPLYDKEEFDGVNYCLRPLDMFMQTIEKEGKTISRFSKIIDPEIISQLENIKNILYK